MVRSSVSILVLCCVLSPALACDWLTHYSDLRNTSMVLVQLMGGELTNENCPVPFPYKMYKRMERREAESQLIFIRDSMKQIFELYRHSNMSSAAWDPVKTQDFLESVNRQIKELDSCISKPNPRINIRVKNYFRKLKDETLSHTGGSNAYWEILRKETKYHLDQLNYVGNRVGDASRGRSATTQLLRRSTTAV